MSRKKLEEREKIREVGKEKPDKYLIKYHTDPFAGPYSTGEHISRRTEEELHSYGCSLVEGTISTTETE